LPYVERFFCARFYSHGKCSSSMLTLSIGCFTSPISLSFSSTMDSSCALVSPPLISRVSNSIQYNCLRNRFFCSATTTTALESNPRHLDAEWLSEDSSQVNMEKTLSTCSSSGVTSSPTNLELEKSPIASTVSTEADTSSTLLSNSAPSQSLEIKDPTIIFESVWTKLEQRVKRYCMCFPKEIIWLMGAPGSGKSFNAPWILQAREITAPELVMSSLLTSPEAERIKEEAGLVGDSMVLEVLLSKLLQPEYANGVVVDGFPRTKVQVECIKMLREKMLALRKEFFDTEYGYLFRRPVFRVAVLFVDEKESVERQLKRGRETREHNQRVRETGIGKLLEERPTDYSEELARRRYGVFKNHYSTLQELKKYFTFSVINTKADIEMVRKNIMCEFMYQSSLELGEETFDTIQKIPIANEVTKHARQNLVRRLDNYQARHADLFRKVIDQIKVEFVPLLSRDAFGGNSVIKLSSGTFAEGVPQKEKDLAVQMTLDVLDERGYHVTVLHEREHIPVRMDLNTGKVICDAIIYYVFNIKFKGAVLRRNEEAFHNHNNDIHL